MRKRFTTKGGVTVVRTKQSVEIGEALRDVHENIDRAKGIILASDYEYPGRYSRWDIGFVDPPVELTSQGRDFQMRALNERGKVLLKLLAPAVTDNQDVKEHQITAETIVGQVKPMASGFAEEDRSKQPSIFSVLRRICALMACKDEYLSMFGAFGYDLVFQFEPIRFRHDRAAAGSDCHLFLTDHLAAIDHQKQSAFKISWDFGDGNLSTKGMPITGSRTEPVRSATGTEVRCDHQPGEYAGKVEKVRQGCKQGDFFEVVLSQVFSVDCGDLPSELFARLRKHNPSPYDFIINLGDEQLIGASPEMFVRADGQEIETCPISGTVKRGASAMEDAEQIQALLSSKKDESELTMCTDVDRNDKSRVCVPGSVQLVGRRMVESYSRLFHTVDHVKGVLKDDCDMFDAFLSHMWACTLTGSPKPIAMQTIEDLENSPRQWYGGSVGLFTFNKQLNTGITIRTIHLQQNVAKVRAGATLLFDSEPDEEEVETRVKASAFLQAIMNKEQVTADVIEESHKKRRVRILFVDNQDSFVHTLANYVRQTGAEVITLRTGFDVGLIDEIKPSLVFISPGPGRPEQMGVPKLVGQAVKRGDSGVWCMSGASGDRAAFWRGTGRDGYADARQGFNGGAQSKGDIPEYPGALCRRAVS